MVYGSESGRPGPGPTRRSLSIHSLFMVAPSIACRYKMRPVMEKYTMTSPGIDAVAARAGPLSMPEIYHKWWHRPEALLLRYDISWSRTPILLSGHWRKSLADNPKTLRLVKLTESSIRKLEPDLVRLKTGDAGLPASHDDVGSAPAGTLLPLVSVMQNNINVYTGNDARFGQLRNALLFGVGAGGVRHSAQRPAGAKPGAISGPLGIDPSPGSRQPAGAAGKDGCLCHP